MRRAFAVKGLAVAVGLGVFWTLPAGWADAVVVVVVLLTVGFLAYAITHPDSQFFAPVTSRLPAGQPVVALTFDDGPDPVFTPRVLDTLSAHRARATFFVLGERAARYPELIRRMDREGHTVGTHTQRHRLRFHFGTPGYIQREIDDAIAVVAGILPRRPTLFRPPQGLRTPCFASGWRRTTGLVCVTWTVRGLDSRPTTAAAIVARVKDRLVPGAIVALHDGTGLGGGADREATLAALPVILGECEQRGLACVSLSELAAGAGTAGAIAGNEIARAVATGAAGTYGVG